jgi:hypothetical protein
MKIDCPPIFQTGCKRFKNLGSRLQITDALYPVVIECQTERFIARSLEPDLDEANLGAFGIVDIDI